MDLQLILDIFQRWLEGDHLDQAETIYLVMNIIIVILLMVLIVLTIILAREAHLSRLIRWNLEDLWHWIKRICHRGE